MAPQPVSSDIVGLEGDKTDFSWDSKDVMLYALGVGARPYEDLDFIYEGKGPKVLPTWAVIPGMRAMSVLAHVEVNPVMILHGEQSITLHRELPPDANVTLQAKIVECWDKGQAAVIGVEGGGSDDQGQLFTTRSTIFVRGAGGFGGERGPSTKGRNEPPDRDPDHTVSEETRIEQAGIYRLSGDRNPLHIDPEFGKAAGFDTPILHGLCTYGFIGRAVLKALCGNDPSKLTSFEARFADVVYPGDTIITKIWRTGNGEALVQGETQKGNVVLSQAKVTFS
jgi:acyl dehydratase